MRDDTRRTMLVTWSTQIVRRTIWRLTPAISTPHPIWLVSA